MLKTKYEDQQKKNPQTPYNAPPQDVVEQIGLEACQPVKTSSAELPTNEGSAIQSAASGEIQERRMLAKRLLQEEGFDNYKSACRAANRTASRPRAPLPQPQDSAHEGLFTTVAQMLAANAVQIERENQNLWQESRLLKLEARVEGVNRLGNLLAIPGTDAKFKLDIQKRMTLAMSQLNEPEPTPAAPSPLCPRPQLRGVTSPGEMYNILEE